MNRSVLCVVGTRPEVVKMATVVNRLRRGDLPITTRLMATGQHRGLLDLALADFDLIADRDLKLMEPGQNLTELTARALVAIGECLDIEKPDLVLAVGDTTTVLATALTCHYRHIAFGHIEAGLRTGNRYLPFPEEKNRELTARLASLHFAPTEQAVRNLKGEGIDPQLIYLTGNPVIDALRQTLRGLPDAQEEGPFVLVTAHRRENWGEPMRQIALGLRDLVERHANLSIVFSVHPNPQVRGPVEEILGKTARIQLIEPVGYKAFVALLASCRLVMTDSGGIQEEAPALGKPVLILRQETERPELVASGLGRLVGTDRGRIVAEVEAIWNQKPTDLPASLPFGDGWATERIVRAIAGFFEINCGSPPVEMPAWPLP